MRRHDREVTDAQEMLNILAKADACRVAFAVDSVPYIVALNFGCEWTDAGLMLYFHCAREGKKLDLMRQNNYVCFQADIDHALQYNPQTNYCTMKYVSIAGMGYLEEVESEEERKHGLDLLMQHHGHTAPDSYPVASLMRTTVLRLRVTEVTAKRNT